MTQQPTNDLKARIAEMQEIMERVVNEYVRKFRVMGHKHDAEKLENVSKVETFLSDLSDVLTPSDSDVKEALDFIENRLSFCRRELHFIAQIHPDYPRFAQELEKMETIRAAIFGLVAQNKELSDLIIKHRCPHEIEG